ncbi:MAG: secondary thiamine-phosphate synthase enzyme YjbQ [Candidatus Fermentibacteraceae bacterium]|nr:secondary thiamine-phosphate synthase enzyme YjbQ [Candidatus Fermentibacteraceae bacterium]
MAIYTSFVHLESSGFGDIMDITKDAVDALRESGIRNGIMTLFVPGSTGSITTIEYEEGVVEDLKDALERLIPSRIPYGHDIKWGDGNGFSHVRAALMGPGITLPIVNGNILIGTWQQIVLIDHDNRQRSRKVRIQIIGECES